MKSPYNIALLIFLAFFSSPRTLAALGGCNFDNENGYQSVFKALKEWGSGKLMKANDDREHVGYLGRKQYLVATVMSCDEIKAAKSNFSEEYFVRRKFEVVNITSRRAEEWLESRLVYLENLPHHDLQDIDQKQLHGEMQLLHGGYIKHLLEGYRQSKDRKSSKLPLLLMYSYYIPCASSSACEKKSSCAQALHGYMQSSNKEVAGIMIAYSQIFKKKSLTSSVADTDQDLARQFMQGPIKCYSDLAAASSNIVFLIYTPAFTPASYLFGRKRKGQKLVEEMTSKVMRTGDLGTVQSVFFDCVQKMPLAACCTSYDGEIRTKIITLSVNHAVYSCLPSNNDVLLKKTYARRELYRCMERWVYTKIGGNCPLCSNNNADHVSAIRQMYFPCIRGAVFSTYRIGKPTVYGSEGVVIPKWTSPDSGSPYAENPREYLARAMLFCQPGGLDLDPIGFCSSKLPNPMMNKAQKGSVKMDRTRQRSRPL